MTSPFAHLPAVLRAHLGALDAGWIDEPRADCGACPLVVLGQRGVPYPFSMDGDARCCTAQPNLANFLVGRVADVASVRRRLADRDGVSAWGIRAIAGYDDAFAAHAARGFGRDVAMRCPFWVGGDHACGVWAGRSARCRGFFCRHDHGLHGAMAWSQAAGLGVALEAALAEHLVDALGWGAGDASDDASDDALLAWYRRCADAVDRLGDDGARDVIARLPPVGDRDPDRIGRSARGQLITRLRRPPAALPAIVVPAVSELSRGDDHVWIAGYSTFDAVRAPLAVFALLALLDGATPWRDALAAVPGLDEALVHELFRVGALRDPGGTTDPLGDL